MATEASRPDAITWLSYRVLIPIVIGMLILCGPLITYWLVDKGWI